MISNAYILPLFAFFQILFALGIALLVLNVLFVPKRLQRIFITASSFHNSNAFPLVIAQALSSQNPFNKVSDSFEKMATYIFIYNLGWSAIFWTWGFGYLSVNEGTVNNENQKKNVNSWNFRLRKGFLNSPMIANYVAFVIGLIPPLKALLHGDGAPLAFLKNGINILGQPAVGIVTLIISGTLGKVIKEKVDRRRSLASVIESDETEKKEKNEENFRLSETKQKEPAMEVQVSNINSNPLTAIDRKNCDVTAHEKEEPNNYSNVWLIAKLCILRVIIIGSLQFALVAILMPLVLPNNADPLMKLVLLIECIPPSANLNLVVSQMAGNVKAAEFLALAYVFMYVLMLFTMMVYLSAAIYLAYGGI